jgi:hypothetical protein
MDTEHTTPGQAEAEPPTGTFGREHIAKVWLMYHQHAAPRGNDRIMLQVLTMHPEYYDAWDRTITGSRDEKVVIDGVNPYLHAYMHAIVENQVESEDPPEVRATYKALLDARMDLHEIIHSIAAILIEQIWAIAAEGASFDREQYVRDLAELRETVVQSRGRR